MQGFDGFGRAEVNGWAEPGSAKAYADGFAAATDQCAPMMVARAQAPAAAAAIRAALLAKVLPDIGPEGPWKLPIPAAIVTAPAC
ncbi:MAG: hypothetical protein GY717_14510 [Rhodobacteraceae bacterium]|nr:hypothetical protein [Paracoccaceae bacterium]